MIEVQHKKLFIVSCQCVSPQKDMSVHTSGLHMQI